MRLHTIPRWLTTQQLVMVTIMVMTMMTMMMLLVMPMMESNTSGRAGEGILMYCKHNTAINDDADSGNDTDEKQ